MDDAIAAALDAMGDLIVMRAADRRITYVNGAVLRAFGGRREDWIGRALGSIMFEDSAAAGVDGRWRATGPLRTVNGPMDVEWEETRLPDGGSVAIGRDVTARLAAQTALEEDRSAAEQRVRDREAVFAMITHELRTPAAGMLGLADVLADTPLTGAQGSYVEALRAGGRHLLKLVDDTLDLARLEAGAFALSPHPTNVAQLASEVAEWLAPQARRKGLTLALWVDPALPAALELDAGRVRQIILNLTGNALKFTDEGGVSIGLEAMAGEDGAQDAAKAGFGGMRIVVEDTGPGVPEEKREAVFQAFVRLEGRGAPREGAGLGLAIAQRLSAAMGGSIGFENVPGAGARFWVRLAVRAASPEPLFAPDWLAGVRVATASPDRFTRRALTRMLNALGAEAVAIASPVDAQEAARNRRLVVDAPWADRVSPGHLGGVLLSDRVGAEEPAALGLDGYGAVLSKPVSLAALAEVLRPPRPVERALDHAVERSWARTPRAAADRRDGASAPDRRRSADEGAGLRGDRALGLAEAGASGPPRAHVLLVEDDDVNRFLARTLLSRLGASVSEARDGRDGLEAAEMRRFDLILMDMRLPGLDGLEVTRRLRRSEGPSQRAPVLGVTANPLAEDRAACLAAGMDEVLVKPLSAAALEAALARWAPQGEPATSTRARSW